MNFLEALRRRHVLLRLRQSPFFSRALRAADFPVWARPSGVPYKVRLRSVQHVSYFMTDRGPEPEIAALMKSVVACLGVETYLDVGANFGFYSWLLPESATGEIDVHLFEPDPANIKLIEETLSRQNSNAILHPVAATSENGSLTFFRDADTGHRGSLVKEDWLGNETIVAARRIDDELDAQSLRGPILIKIDVEGGEEEVLRGAEKLLERDPIIMIECLHDLVADSGPGVLKARPGYRLIDAKTAGPLTPSTTNYLAVPPSVSDAELESIVEHRHRMLG